MKAIQTLLVVVLLKTTFAALEFVLRRFTAKANGAGTRRDDWATV